MGFLASVLKSTAVPLPAATAVGRAGHLAFKTATSLSDDGARRAHRLPLISIVEKRPRPPETGSKFGVNAPRWLEVKRLYLTTKAKCLLQSVRKFGVFSFHSDGNIEIPIGMPCLRRGLANNGSDIESCRWGSSPAGVMVRRYFFPGTKRIA